ncbi:MAG: YheU family protein [Tatlockia sp.]|nr:YheU family protein [Tatlockia sp.]
MIEINYKLLSKDALDSLVIDVLTRQSSDYGGLEISFEDMKNKLMRNLETAALSIVFYPDEGYCDIVSAETLHSMRQIK